MRPGSVSVTILIVVVGLGLLTLHENAGVRLLPAVSAQSAAPAAPSASDTPNLVWAAANPATMKAVAKSIRAQLEAFKKDDYTSATIYESSVLRQNFESADIFRQMMKTDYPEFANYKSVEFGPMLTTADKKVIQAPVKLTGTNGNHVNAVYLMILEGGIYRVAGVEEGSTVHPIDMPTDPSIT